MERLYLWFAPPVILVTAWLYTAAVAQTRFPTLRNKAIVLLIAHPDDEAMFFAPTVLGLTRPELGNHLKILCLSSGNAENIGPIRKKEILASARLLGLRSDTDVHVIEDPSFPDSMREHWDSLKIAQLLDTFFIKSPTNAKRKNVAESGSRDQPPATSIDVLITFDKDGVSGHPNHKSLHAGAVRWIQNLVKGRNGWESPVKLYRLESTNMARKYLGLLDAPFTLLSTVIASISTAGKKGDKQNPAELMFLSDYPNYRKAQKAMTEAHKSQMVWFRWGWICLSRYMVVNSLTKESIRAR